MGLEFPNRNRSFDESNRGVRLSATTEWFQRCS